MMRRVISILVLCAAVAGGIAHFARRGPVAAAGVADSATSVRANASFVAADADGVRPVPGLGPVLDNLSHVSAAGAAALLGVESRLFTRLDSANAVAFGCDEAMPVVGLFAAHARVIDASDDLNDPGARLEVTSVGRASLTYESGCELEGAEMEPGVRVDTVGIRLERRAGELAFTGMSATIDNSVIAFAGPMRGHVKADWKRLTAQADSIRLAHGQPPARALGTVDGRYAARGDGSLGFPERYPHCVASVDPLPVAAGAKPRMAIAPAYGAGDEEAEGTWLLLSESADGACVTPLSITSMAGRRLSCGRGPEHPGGWLYRSDSVLSRVILVRDVPGVRTGPTGAPLTMVVGPSPGAADGDWTRADRVHVFDARGEVLRVVESEQVDGSAGAGARSLVARYGGRTSRLPGVLVGPTAHWAVLWVGLLNADTIPDLIVRVQRPNADVQEHEFDLLLSAPDGSGKGVVWQHGVRTWLTTCR